MEIKRKCSAVGCEAVSTYEALCSVRVKDTHTGSYKDIRENIYFCKAHWETQLEIQEKTKVYN